jgi:hypothetical protein
MSETKFTPGPWEWDGNVWDYNPVFEAPWLEGEDGRIVLRGQITCSSEANAHLIATAPELYVALEYVLNVCPAIDPSGEDAHEKARAVLAKARGEA